MSNAIKEEVIETERIEVYKCDGITYECIFPTVPMAEEELIRVAKKVDRIISKYNKID